MPNVRGALYLAGTRRVEQAIDKVDLTIACDRAALYRLAWGHSVDVAIGDFDSVTVKEQHWIVNQVKHCVTLPTAKDDTDSQAAVLWFFERYPLGELWVYGALGGRIDHTLVNLFLPSHPKISPFMQQISLISSSEYITYYPEGRHEISRQPGYQGLAFVVEGAGEVEILGAQFELTSTHYFSRKVYSSNAFTSGPVTLCVPKGTYVICLQTNEEE